MQSIPDKVCYDITQFFLTKTIGEGAYRIRSSGGEDVSVIVDINRTHSIHNN